jgi:hypothetical protein
MSPLIEPSTLSTALFASLRLHGDDWEHALPEPLGDAYKVAWTAALATDEMPTTPR